MGYHFTIFSKIGPEVKATLSLIKMFWEKIWPNWQTTCVSQEWLFLEQETAEDGMAGLQSKFQNLNAKVIQRLTKMLTDRRTDIINPYAGIALQSSQ